MNAQYTVVATADDEAHWLRTRLDYATGSEIATIMGRAPTWFEGSRDELVEQKRTKVGSAMKANRRMWHGAASERGNIHVFERLTGARSRPTHCMVASAQARISATLDGLIKPPKFPERGEWPGNTSSDAHFGLFMEEFERQRGLGLLEAKQSAGWKGQIAQWDVAPPDYYFTQVQAGLYVLGLEWGVIFARLGVDDYRAHVIAADAFFQAEMVEAVEEFWREVEEGR